jgi:magnesium chelatase accessory protein
MAGALGDLALALGRPPDAVLGHSAGAALALRATLDGRWQPVQLVGLNAALVPFDGLAGRLFGPMARVLSSQPLVPWLVARGARDAAAVRRLVDSTGSRLDAEGLALYARLVRSPEQVAGALAMMADWDLPGLWNDLPRLAVPLSLLVGAADRTVPPAQARRVAAHLRGVRLATLAGLGHLAHEEAPARVAAQLLAWLAPLVDPGP